MIATPVIGVQEMIDEADRDGDGEISEEEFLRIMKKTSLYWATLAGFPWVSWTYSDINT